MPKLTFESCLAAYEELMGPTHPKEALAIGRGRCVVRVDKGLFVAKRGDAPVEKSALAFDSKDWDAERGCWVGESPEATVRFIERPIFIAVVRQCDVERDVERVERAQRARRAAVHAGSKRKAESARLAAALTAAEARTAELESVLSAVQQEFRRLGGGFPDGFDARVFRWVNDVMAGHAAPPFDVELVRRATPGAWFVRKRERDGEVLDAFVAAPDCQGLPYDAEVLGDDEYREDQGLERKLADCALVVLAVNEYKARAGQRPALAGAPCAA